MHRSYRFARRSFLAGIGGAVGLKVLLGNLEAMAQGMKSPPRFFAMHWPVGTIKYAFLPNGGVKPNGVGSITSVSPILQPFKDRGLDGDMSLFWGLRDFGQFNGGAHETGTAMTVSGTVSPDIRYNAGQPNDGVAGGPSWDQIILNNVKDDPSTGAVSMKRPGVGYANALCDERVDLLATSPRCLSYSLKTRTIAAGQSQGKTVTEHVPLLPTLSPAQLYMELFAGLMPGGSTPENIKAAKLLLVQRKSVLDMCLRELDDLKSLAPASEASKIEIHADVCRTIEMQVSDYLNGKVSVDGCVVPMAPDPAIVGQSAYTTSMEAVDNPSTADDQMHAAVGKLHCAVLLAAMQCNLISTATFQWSPGTNHVSFKGLKPDSPNGFFMHHPVSHKIIGKGREAYFDAAPNPNDAALVANVQFMINVHKWYNERTADIIKTFKDAADPFGGNMLDNTVIPYFTETAMATHAVGPKPALFFGGKALGMQHGKYVNFEEDSGERLGARPQLDFWATIAQAYFRTNELAPYLNGLTFATTPKPIDGFWVKPA